MMLKSIDCTTKYFTGKLSIKYSGTANRYVLINLSTEEQTRYHLIRQIKCGKQDGTDKVIELSFTQAELKSLYEYHKHSDFGPVKATLRTYSDSEYKNEVGTATAKSIELYIPEEYSLLPKVTLSIKILNNVIPEENREKFKDTLIQNVSRLECKITAKDKDGKDLPPKDCWIDINNVSYGYEHITNIFTAPGYIRILGIAVDYNSDNTFYAKAVTDNYYVSPYSKPTVKVLVCERCDENHNPKDNGKFLHIKATRNYTEKLGSDKSIDNYCYVKYICRYANGNPKTSGILKFEDGSNTTEEYLENVVEDTQSSYQIDLYASDEVTGDNRAISRIISSENIDFHLGGNKIGLGGYAINPKTIEFLNDWKLGINGDYVSGFVVKDGIYQIQKYCDTTASAVAPDPETGIEWPANKWHYKIWNNGQYLMFGNFAIVVGSATAVGSLFKTATLAIEAPFNILNGYVAGHSKDSNMWVADSGIMRLGVEDSKPFNAIFIKNLFPAAIAQDSVHPMRLIVTGFIDE